MSRSTLPEDWQPSPLDIAFALSCGLDPGAMADAFADHYRALGAVRADWGAAWRQWCRREPRFNRHQHDPNPITTAVRQVVADLEMQAAAAEAADSACTPRLAYG